MGTRAFQRKERMSRPDHPHACGDKTKKRKPSANAKRSSPRVWGQDTIDIGTKKQLGIIPTRVGTSCCKQVKHGRNQDHPHACGDKAVTQLYRSKDRGSSPRVWGQVIFGRQLQGNHRIIPTRVGTRLDLMPRYINAKDHPHACGDKCRIANWKASS